MASAGRALVHPAIDGWLLGGVAIAAWLAFTPLDGGAAPIAATGLVGAVFLGLGAAHFGVTYHLAYGLPADVRRRYRWALVGAPIAIGVILAAIVAANASGATEQATAAVRWLFILVFSLTGWHYIKQAFGVALIAGRTRGIRTTKTESLTMRYAFYPVWAVTLARVWVEGAGATYRGVDVTVDVFPSAAGTVLRGAALLGLAVAIGVMVRAGARARAVPPMGMWAPYVAGGLWLLYSPGVIGSSVVLAGLHGLQYLACVHRAEVDWAHDQGETGIATLWLSIMGGALAAGLLMSSWLPTVLDSRMDSTSLPGLYGSLVFIALNLHHYAIDAAIWRHDGPHISRISKGPQVAAERLPGLSAVPA